MDRDAIDLAIGRPWYACRLGAPLEELYEERTGAARQRQTAIVLMIFSVGVLATLAIDYATGLIATAFWLKIGLDLPLFVLASFAQLLPLRANWRAFTLILPFVATVATTTLLAMVAPWPFGDRYLMAAGMVAVSVNFIMPCGLRIATALCASNVATYASLAAFADFKVAGSSMSCDLVFFFLGVTLVTLRTVARRERSDKDAFLLRLRDEIRAIEMSGLVDELSRLAHSDALTGAGNRRSFDLRLAAAWRTASVQGGTVALLLIDVDRLKLFNDNAGHAAGDVCLRAVAGAISAGANCGLDAVSRYGGEEFALILQSHLDHVDAAPVDVAERVRRSVEALAYPHPGLPDGSYVTISIGVAVARPAHDATTLKSLIEAADSALYRSKRNGRNRIGATMGPPVAFAA